MRPKKSSKKLLVGTFRGTFDANLVSWLWWTLENKYRLKNEGSKEPDTDFLTKMQFSIWIKPIYFKNFAFENKRLIFSLKSEKKLVIAFLCKMLIRWLYLIFWPQVVETYERCDWKIA